MKTKTNGSAKPATQENALRRIGEDARAIATQYQQIFDAAEARGEDLAKLAQKYTLLPWSVKVQVASQAAHRRDIVLPVAVDSYDYGHLCAAARLHGYESPAEMAAAYLERTLCEWSNNGYLLED